MCLFPQIRGNLLFRQGTQRHHRHSGKNRWQECLREIWGNSALVRHLQTAAAGGRVSHAYLFTGGAGAGKRMFANTFAKALLRFAGTKTIYSNIHKFKTLPEPAHNSHRIVRSKTLPPSLPFLPILQDEDAGEAISHLNEAGFQVTRLATKGGFLRAGNTTLLW